MQCSKKQHIYKVYTITPIENSYIYCYDCTIKQASVRLKSVPVEKKLKLTSIKRKYMSTDKYIDERHSYLCYDCLLKPKCRSEKSKFTKCNEIIENDVLIEKYRDSIYCSYL